MAIAYTVPQVGGTSISAPIVGTSATFGSITVDTARPYTLSNMGVSTGLTLDAIDKKLRIESTLDSVFVDVGQDVVFTGKKIMIPDAVITRLKTTEKGARTQTIPLLRPVAGPGRGGTGESQMGYERGMVMQYMKVYYNEYSQAIAGEEYGVNYNDLQLFNYFAQIQPALSKWFAEDEDKQYHQALLETFAWPLVKTGAGLTDGTSNNWNSNWFVPNLDFASQPAYDSTKSDFTTALATAFAAADTGTNGVNATIDLDYLLALEYYASTVKRIEPVTIGGKKSYIVMVPSPQMHKLMLQLRTGTSLFQNTGSLSDEERNLPFAIGRVKSLMLIEDPRYPTIEFDDYVTPVVTTEYVEPGNDDNRNKTIYDASSNPAWDIGFLLGANALVDWTVTPLHFEMEKTDYGKKYGKGAFIERGIQLGLYDVDTPTDTTRLNYGSIVCPFASTSIISVA